MDKFVIEGGTPLHGEIATSGSKNSALPALAAAMLTDEPVVLKRIPRVRDIRTMERLLVNIGSEIAEHGETITLQTKNIVSPEAPYELVKTMRASSLVLGPLVARAGRARVSMPGGCAIGARPIDFHLAGLQHLGATISQEYGYIEAVAPDGLKGARIGVLGKAFGFNPAVDKLMEAALEAMKQQGATLVDPVELETFGKFGETEFLGFMYELKADLNAYLTWLGPNAPVKTLKEVIEFNEKNAAKEMPYFGQENFLKAEEKGPLTTKEYVEAIKKNHDLAGKEGIDKTMDKHKLDAIVAPTGGPAWLTDIVNGDSFGGGSSEFAAVAGYPNVNVVAGYSYGLPVGISFFGRAWSEPVLIKLAYSFEQATKFRKAPKFLPHVEG